MNKKDMFIRDKLQKDKQISDKADKIFNNFKEEFKLENNEGKKVIKISFNKFLAIAASVAIVGALGTILCVKKPWENKLKSNIQAEQKNEPEINIDEIAKELFEEGAEEIRKLEYAGKPYEIAKPEQKREINGKEYIKTTEKYETVEKKYGQIFTEEALENVLAKKFINVNGILYMENAWRSNRMGYYKFRNRKSK